MQPANNISIETRVTRMMDKYLKDIKLYDELLSKDCNCPDHDGPHDFHVSRVRLLDNYNKLIAVLSYFEKMIIPDQFVHELLQFFESELDRQQDFLSDLHLNSWRLNNRNIDNSDAQFS